MNKRQIIAVVLMTSVVGCATAPPNRPRISNVETSSAILLSECINSIKSRLRTIQDNQSQLLGTERATPTTLHYTRSKALLLEVVDGSIQLSSAGSCQLEIALTHPVSHTQAPKESETAKAWYFPQVRLGVEMIFVCAGPDGTALRKTVESIVHAEAVWLAVRLDMAKKVKPNKAL